MRFRLPIRGAPTRGRCLAGRLVGRLLGGGLIAFSLGCATADEQRQAADDEVYTIIRERREQLTAGDGFTLAAPESTLRHRLLAGDAVSPLGLEALLIAASENSREYQERRESLFLAALDLTLERWRFSVQEGGFFDLFSEGVGGDSGLQGLLSSVTFSRLFASGMQVVAGAGLDLLLNADGGSGWDAVSSASVDITQPLLRGFGGEIVREPLTQAERDVLYEARVYERFRSTFAFDVTSRFFAILRQLDRLENERENEKRVQTLRERNEAFAEAGLLNEIEVDQARQDELASRNRLIEAERDLQTALDDFKLFLGLPIGTELPLAIEGYLTIDRWEFLALEPSEQVVIALALSRRLDHLTTVERFEDAERRVVVARDALRAGLDLEVSADAASPLGEPGKISLDDTAWRVDLLVDLPIDRLPERNAYRASLIDLEQARRNVEESADSITADLREELLFLQAARESYEIQRNAVDLAVRRVESSELQLEAGRVDTQTVLDSQNALLDVRNALTAAQSNYILSGLALYRDMELIRIGPEGFHVDTAVLTSASAEPSSDEVLGPADPPVQEGSP
ncbi:MAG: TolC family protein [Planctomycetota bacterium]|jgi:outer membrane protein TolC